MTRKKGFSAAALATACAAAACGAPSERHAPSAAALSSPPVSAGEDAEAAPGRQKPGPLLDLPAAPAPGPALLPEDHEGGAPAPDVVDPLLDVAGAAAPAAPRIVLGDDEGFGLASAIFGTELETLDLPGETAEGAGGPGAALLPAGADALE